jgi:hypothetical protein
MGHVAKRKYNINTPIIPIKNRHNYCPFYAHIMPTDDE